MSHDTVDLYSDTLSLFYMMPAQVQLYLLNSKPHSILLRDSL